MGQWGNRIAAAVLVAGLAQAGVAGAQPVTSSPAAPVKELASLLVGKGTGSGAQFVAAEDPRDATRFVAAMLLPDLQLLLVSASVLIGLLVIYSSWSLITQSVAVLMEGAHRRQRRAASAARTATRQSCSRPARLDDHQRVRRALSACHES